MQGLPLNVTPSGMYWQVIARLQWRVMLGPAPWHDTPVPMLGHVTSSYWSPNLGRGFALALVKGGRRRLGETVLAPLPDGRVVASRIVAPVFFDAEGARLDA